MTLRWISPLSYSFWGCIFGMFTLLLNLHQAKKFYHDHQIEMTCPTIPQKGVQKESKPQVLLIGSAYTFGEREWQSRLHAALSIRGIKASSALAAKAYDHDLHLMNLRLWPIIPLGYPSQELKTYIWFSAINFLLKPDLVVFTQAMYMSYFPQAQQAALISADDVEPASLFSLLDILMFSSSNPNYCQYYTPTTTQSVLLDIYPSTGKTSFKPLSFHRLFFCGAFCDRDIRSSQKYKDFYNQLDQLNLISFYGPKKSWKRFRNYKGMIPFGSDQFEVELQTCGIGLCLHSKRHRETGTPTARIFELAAASALIICDDHPFVRKHFQDNVLYIHTRKDAIDMTAQILRHLAWIKTHPHEAQEKARKAHAIFKKKFPLEKTVDKLIKAWKSKQECHRSAS